MKSKKGSVEVWVIGIFLILLAISLVYNVIYAFTSGSESITIEEKWVKYKGDKAKYLVSTTNDQVFEISDTWIKGRWDSSNLYAKLKEGQTCKLETQGWRFPFLSDYKNIITAECNEAIEMIIP